MSSRSSRLLISVSLLLLFFFSVTIVVLDIAFRKAGEQAQQDILDGQLMSLLAAAEPNIYGELQIPPDLPEPRFSSVDSGLYGELRDDSGEPVWKSQSALGLDLPYGERPQSGQHRFSRLTLDDGTPLMALSLSVEWELANGELRPYTFSVAESLDSFHAQLARFRGQLFGWFAAVAIIMLFSISLVMRGLLRPLRQIEKEIGEIEEGKRGALSDIFPAELQGVARNLNLLIGTERARAEPDGAVVVWFAGADGCGSPGGAAAGWAATSRLQNRQDTRNATANRTGSLRRAIRRKLCQNGADEAL